MYCTKIFPFQKINTIVRALDLGGIKIFSLEKLNFLTTRLLKNSVTAVLMMYMVLETVALLML